MFLDQPRGSGGKGLCRKPMRSQCLILGEIGPAPAELLIEIVIKDTHTPIICENRQFVKVFAYNWGSSRVLTRLFGEYCRVVSGKPDAYQTPNQIKPNANWQRLGITESVARAVHILDWGHQCSPRTASPAVRKQTRLAARGLGEVVAQ